MANQWFEGLEGLEGFEALEGGAGLVTIAAGIGAMLLAPVIAPILGQAGKPVVKRAIREGILFYERGKETLAEMGDAWEDIVAEARYEASQVQQERVTEPTSEPHAIPVED